MVLGRRSLKIQNRIGLSGLRGERYSFHDQNREHSRHIPVLQREVQRLLVTDRIIRSTANQYYVDGTVGCGGHAKAILHSAPNIHMLCIDRDPHMLSIAKENLIPFEGRVFFKQGSFVNLASYLQEAGFPSIVSGILVDLGANSLHFDTPERGFSYSKTGPLDMRYNTSDAYCKTAGDILASASEVDLTQIFQKYGEDRLAKEYAKAIVRERDAIDDGRRVFETTFDLRRVIDRIAQKWTKARRISRDLGPVSRCFQALRIHVNEEIDHVHRGIPILADHLAPLGRLATIAFHSLEDRPIKQLFRNLHQGGFAARVESRPDDLTSSLFSKGFHFVKRKALKATAEEILINSRARSARLRCIERHT